MKREYHEAEYYEKKEENKVACKLCPWMCVIKPGELGNCNARQNRGGTLYALGYDYFTSAHADPIEKKPLYHFKPGSRAMSFGTAGCNLHCDFCQNWTISQMSADSSNLKRITSKDAVELTKKRVCESIAYTYNEPLINFEWIKDTGKLAHEKGIKNVVVSNGLLNPEPLKELIPLIDAANIDIKSFDKKFYKDITHFPGLEQIKANAIKLFAEGVHIELTMLLIPGYNDDEDNILKFSEWVLESLDENVPIHFSRFYPHYKMQHIDPTPVETVLKAQEIAKDAGLSYVFVGNLPTNEENLSQCKKCDSVLIKRIYYSVKKINLDDNGKCKECGNQSDIIL